MSDILGDAALGLAPGGVYALLALGIVLIYRGSGVLNFAHGATAMFSTYVFLYLDDQGLSNALAVVVTLVMAGTFGALFSLKVMRPLRHAPMLARVVPTLGLAIMLQGAAELIFPQGTTSFAPVHILPYDGVGFLGGVGEDRLYVAGIAILLAAGLSAIYRWTSFGLVTRGAAENEKGALLLGYSPDRISAVNWALGTTLAAIAGILISPIIQVTSTGYTLLVIPALAAALIARFQSFAITAIAALGLGIIQSLVTARVDSLPLSLHIGLSDALPFTLIIVFLILAGRSIPSRQVLLPRRPPVATPARPNVVALVVLAALAVYVLVGLPTGYAVALSTTATFVVVALSVVVVTGYAGQISLAQMGLAGLGGVFVFEITDNTGIGFPFSLVLAAICVVPIGVLVGLPAVRVRGINLAIVTLGFSVAITAMVFANGDLLTGTDGFFALDLPSPSLFGYSLDALQHPDRYATFTVVVAGLCLAAVSWLRRSESVRRMLAVRDNERAAAAMGVNVPATKLLAFAIAAFFAGLAGGMIGMQTNVVAFDRFAPLASVFLVASVYVAGIGSVGGAIFAGIVTNGGIVSYAISQEVQSLDKYSFVISGAALIYIAMSHPDGVVPTLGERRPGGRRWSIRRVRRGQEAPPPVELAT